MSYDEPYEDAEPVQAARRRMRPDRHPGETLGARQKRLWEAAETLDNALDTLSERLVPVLSPDRPEAELSGIASDPAERSELSGFLDQLTDRLSILGRRTSALSQRVDL